MFQISYLLFARLNCSNEMQILLNLFHRLKQGLENGSNGVEDKKYIFTREK